ncbi:MAG TPA: AAA family ATPase [Pirellulales bacterium]|nr:AAA family ATPase [Pirellulales bacterium]
MSTADYRPRHHIRELRLKNFRVFQNARLPLDDLTVVVGRNGAGKTTLMEGFEFLQDAVRNSLTTALERRGGPGGIRHSPPTSVSPPLSRRSQPVSEIELAILIEFPTTSVLYGFSISVPRPAMMMYRVAREVLHSFPKTSFSFERVGNDFKSALPGLQPRFDQQSLALPLVAGADPVWAMTLDVVRNLRVYNFAPQLMQAEPLIAADEGLALARDGANLGDVLHRMKNDRSEMDWIVRHLSAVTPGITGVYTRAHAGRRVIRFDQRVGELRNVFVAAHMSNGTLHSLGVLVALRQQPVPSLVFIDEIECSIHTAALAALMDAAQATSQERCQVVIASHSTDALSHHSVTGRNLRIVDWHDGQSHLFLPGSGTIDLLRPPESVGRLMRSNGLWPAENPSIVEGDILDVPSVD